MTNDEARKNDEARMTKASTSRMFEASKFVVPFTYSSRSWRRLDAVPLLPASAYGPLVSIPALLGRSCEGNAWFRVLPCGKFQCFSETPSWKLRHRLRRNWRQHLSRHRQAD